MLLTDFFHDAGFKLGVFYPKHCLTAIFESLSTAEHAEAALLRDGFEEDHTLVASGREVIEYDRDHTTVLSLMMRAASRFFKTEQSFNDDSLAHAHHGAGFLLVRCSDDNQKAKAWDIVKNDDPLDARYYSLIAIEHLAGDADTD